MSKAQRTRQNILNKAFELMYRKGYQATSIEDIIATTQVTKGALYYHFKNKEEMGLAMIDEVLTKANDASTSHPLLDVSDPRGSIHSMMEALLIDRVFFRIEYGCPIVNLIDEMAPLNAEFAQKLRTVTVNWMRLITEYLERAKAAGTIDDLVDTEQVATFIITGYHGARNLGKILGEASYSAYLEELKLYLEILLPGD